MNEDICDLCQEESTKGCHGVKDGVIYSEYYCDDCYNSKPLKSEKNNEILANAV